MFMLQSLLTSGGKGLSAPVMVGCWLFLLGACVGGVLNKRVVHFSFSFYIINKDIPKSLHNQISNKINVLSCIHRRYMLFVGNNFGNQ